MQFFLNKVVQPKVCTLPFGRNRGPRNDNFLSFQIIYRPAKTRPEQQRRSQAEKLSIADVGVAQRRINVDSKRRWRFRGSPLFRRQRSSLRWRESFG